MASRFYIKSLGGSNEVDSLVSLGGVMYGTTLANLATLLGVGNCLGIIGCEQMSIGSSFLGSLNTGDDTIGNVHYTNIVTSMDEIIIPYTNGYLNDDGNNVNTNVRSRCWTRVIGQNLDRPRRCCLQRIQDALAHWAISYACWAL